MIQMGICESSCLEISNVICKVRGEARSTALLFWGPGGSLGWCRRVGDSWHLAGELHPLLQEMLKGWVAPACREASELPALAKRTPDLSDQVIPPPL